MAIPNFLLDLKFKVVSFSMIVNVLKENNSISKEVSLNSNSACITNEMKEYILNPNIESTINFDDIKVECPDGSTRRINNRITINGSLILRLKRGPASPPIKDLADFVLIEIHHCWF